MKYCLSPREIPRAKAEGFSEGSGYISSYFLTRVTIQTFSIKNPALTYLGDQYWNCTWECLYCDSSRDIRWNIASALGKSLGLCPRDFPWAQAIFHSISLLFSQYRYKVFKLIWPPNSGTSLNQCIDTKHYTTYYIITPVHIRQGKANSLHYLHCVQFISKLWNKTISWHWVAKLCIFIY